MKKKNISKKTSVKKITKPAAKSAASKAHSNLVSAEDQTLWELALKASQKAYSPYSEVKIGSALLLKGDETFYSGCNIENVSYGGTVCAERVAIWKAVSELAPTDLAKRKIRKILVISDADPAWPPCGMCRQVISEFGAPDTEVLISNHQGIQKRWRLDKIFPDAFYPEFLGQ